jgi:hypothetical protein
MSTIGCQANLKKHVLPHKSNYNIGGVDVESYSIFWFILKVYVNEGPKNFTFLDILHPGHTFRCTCRVEHGLCNTLFTVLSNMMKHLHNEHNLQRNQANTSTYIKGKLTPIFEEF